MAGRSLYTDKLSPVVLNQVQFGTRGDTWQDLQTFLAVALGASGMQRAEARASAKQTS